MLKTLLNQLDTNGIDDIATVENNDNITSSKIIFNSTAIQRINALTDLEQKVFFDNLKKSIKKSVKSSHNQVYNNDVYFAIANNIKTVVFDTDKVDLKGDNKLDDFTFKTLSSDVMSTEVKKEYKSIVSMLQCYLATVINLRGKKDKKSTDIVTKSEKALKDKMQELSDLYFNNSTNQEVKLFINNNDIDFLKCGIVKENKNNFTTIGDKAFISLVDAVFYHKIQSKDYFVSVFTSDKNNNGLTIIEFSDAKKTTKKAKTDNKKTA